jgi:hypothetical protein
MKIFVGYGFNERDQWIPKFVFPLIESFGSEAITGEELQGEIITEAVKQKIRSADAFIGFATRRQQNGAGWTTHRWVTDELAIALSRDMPVLEVRERDVDEQGGIAGDRQRIEYDESQRDRCLVELVKTLGHWHRNRRVQLQLLPQDIALKITPLSGKTGLRCTYQILEGFDEKDEVVTKLLPIKGGLFISTGEVPRGSLVRVKVQFGNAVWLSNYESPEAVGIALREES